MEIGGDFLAQIIKEVKVEVLKPNLFQAVVAKQHDCNSRFIKATFMNSNKKIDISHASKVTINARRPDGLSKSFEGVVNEDSTVTVPLHSWILEVDGLVDCDISTITEEGEKLTSTKFLVFVEKASCGDDDISTDPQYDILVDLINQVENLGGDAPDETIVKTVDTKPWDWVCIPSDDIYKPELGKQYFVTLKNNDGTPLGAPMFKLMTDYDSYAGAFPTTYTLVYDGTYQTGQGILGENSVVELVDWNNGNPIFRFGGANAISIATQKPYKKIKFYFNGNITGDAVNGTYFTIRLRDDISDYNNLKADVPLSLAINGTAGQQLVIQSEIYKISDTYQVSATANIHAAGNKGYGTVAKTRVEFLEDNSDIKPCNVMFSSNKATHASGMVYANGSKIICEVWHE